MTIVLNPRLCSDKGYSSLAERSRTNKSRCRVRGLCHNALIVRDAATNILAPEHFGRLHDRSKCPAQLTVHVTKSNLVAGVHPSKAFAWNKLEVHPHVAILHLHLVRHVHNIKFLRHNPVKVNKGFCDANESSRGSVNGNQSRDYPLRRAQLAS